MQISPYAGQHPTATDTGEAAVLVDVAALLKSYDRIQPDPAVAAQRVSFGTSGHRGSALEGSFNRNHILAITQAICDYRHMNKIEGPLFLGFDTHALSMPAFRTTVEVLAANEVTVMIAAGDEFTPTPVISHAILTYNLQRTSGLADGIVITPSHNPPSEGGFKYNPTHGGPAEKEITDWVQNRANSFLEMKLQGVQQMPYERALKTSTTQPYDFVTPYVGDLENVISFDPIRNSKIKIGVDPLGGAGVHYWQRIADLYKIDMSVLNTTVDPQFKFMTRDWDGKIRMDPSSQYAMRSLIEKGRAYDISFACDTDHDRHGIVTKSGGLMGANDYLATCIFYLFQNRPDWPPQLQIGKTLVSSQMVDRVGQLLQRAIYEVPVGFKWFVEGLHTGRLGFAGEESAGSSFLRRNATAWTTDKDGIIAGLLAAEMTAVVGKDPAQIYKGLTERLGRPIYSRVEGKATAAEKKLISNFQVDKLRATHVAGDQILRVLTEAPGNHAPIGGVKIETSNGWLAVRPSGTEDVYKIYGESFVDEAHLKKLLSDGQEIIAEMSKASK